MPSPLMQRIAQEGRCLERLDARRARAHTHKHRREMSACGIDVQPAQRPLAEAPSVPHAPDDMQTRRHADTPHKYHTAHTHTNTKTRKREETQPKMEIPMVDRQRRARAPGPGREANLDRERSPKWDDDPAFRPRHLHPHRHHAPLPSWPDGAPASGNEESQRPYARTERRSLVRRVRTAIYVVQPRERALRCSLHPQSRRRCPTG